MSDYSSSALLLIVLLPAIGALINGLFGHRLPRWLVSTVGCASVGGAFGLSLWAGAHIIAANGQERLIQNVYSWITVAGLDISVSFTLDALAAVMALVVTGVSFLIHIYSIGYMHGDPLYHRYFSFLNLFVFAMLILVLADSLPLLFVGWEGVGLCSYLLIGFWFEDPAKASAGKKAFIVNRIGDLGFLIGIFILFNFTGTLTVDGLSAAAGQIPAAWVTAACIMLFVGACGKSAQIPLYVWLPDAMAGPTPVSALIHAATMVTAGVYMVARLSFLFTLSPTASAIVTLVGAATAFFAATIGLAQTDIKKVLAYSTVSQLGYMVIAVGIGAYAVGIFHLMTHAFFKACLFLGAGAVIHALEGEQDILKMGGLRKKLKWTYWTFLISTITIAGFPPFAGFWSKDEILWKAFSTANTHGHWLLGSANGIAYVLGIAGAALTSFYMFRLVFLTFHGESRLDPRVHVHHEMPVMSWPLAILAALAMVGGLVQPGLFHKLWLSDFLAPVVAASHAAEKAIAHSASWEWAMAGVSVAVAGFSLFLAWHLYLVRTQGPAHLAATFRRLHSALLNKWWLDEIYQMFVIKPIHGIAILLWKLVDVVIIDGICVNGPAHLLRGVGFLGRELQSGNVQVYAFWIFAGFCGILFYLLYFVGLFG